MDVAISVWNFGKFVFSDGELQFISMRSSTADKSISPKMGCFEMFTEYGSRD